jgi:hypothetical protein
LPSLLLLLSNRGIPHGEIVLITAIHGIRVSGRTTCGIGCGCGRLRS